MPDLTTQGVIGTFAAIVKLVQVLNQSSASPEIKAQLSALYDAIIAGQQRAFEDHIAKQALLEDKGQLEKELAQIKAWGTEKQRYQLVSPCEGATVYALKKAVSNGEPPHYICTNCYQQGKPSILQNFHPKDGWTVFVCSVCKSQVPTGYNGRVPAQYAEEAGKR
jgi:hypothetical protein